MTTNTTDAAKPTTPRDMQRLFRMKHAQLALKNMFDTYRKHPEYLLEYAQLDFHDDFVDLVNGGAYGDVEFCLDGLSASMQLHRSHVKKLLNGTAVPSPKQMAEIAAFFGKKLVLRMEEW